MFNQSNTNLEILKKSEASGGRGVGLCTVQNPSPPPQPQVSLFASNPHRKHF